MVFESLNNSRKSCDKWLHLVLIVVFMFCGRILYPVSLIQCTRIYIYFLLVTVCIYHTCILVEYCNLIMIVYFVYISGE